MSDRNARIEMENATYRVLVDGEVAFQAVIEDRGVNVGVTFSLPLPDAEDWVSCRLDLVSTVGLLTWLGHATKVVEAGATEDEIRTAKAMLDDMLQNRTQHPQSRQQRRAAERRQGKQ